MNTKSIAVRTLAASVGAVLLISAAGAAQAATVDLSTWAEDGTGNWIVAGDQNSVTQTVNGNPVVFYSDFDGQGKALSGKIRVATSSDNDFIGFVLGYNPGELAGPASDFLVIDWKQGTQSQFGCSGASGLSISHASAGLANNAAAWCHTGTVTELARANTLGSTGWLENIDYAFDIAFTSTNVTVSVNGIEELNIDGAFSNGRFGFYNYSQAGVTYAAIQQDILPDPPVSGIPEPATWAMMITGFGLAGSMLRRTRRTTTVA